MVLWLVASLVVFALCFGPLCYWFFFFALDICFIISVVVNHEVQSCLMFIVNRSWLCSGDRISFKIVNMNLLQYIFRMLFIGFHWWVLLFMALSFVLSKGIQLDACIPTVKEVICCSCCWLFLFIYFGCFRFVFEVTLIGEN